MKDLDESGDFVDYKRMKREGGTKRIYFRRASHGHSRLALLAGGGAPGSRWEGHFQARSWGCVRLGEVTWKAASGSRQKGKGLKSKEAKVHYRRPHRSESLK